MRTSSGLTSRKRACLSISLFFCSALLFTGAGSVGLAEQVRITVTGTVTAGIDESGVFGAPNTSLVGKTYWQVFLLDPSKGTSSVVGNPPYYSTIAAKSGSNPMWAALTIAGGTVFYGVRPTLGTPNSLVSKEKGGVMSISNGSENYWVGNAFGEGANTAYMIFTLPVYSPSYNWKDPFTYTAAQGNTSDGSFVIYYGTFNAKGAGTLLQNADGNFKVKSITVSAPSGPLTMETLEAVTVHGADNTATWEIKWQLTTPAKASGWIIQHVTMVTNITGDPKSPYSASYYEAWPVLAGAVAPVEPDDSWTNSAAVMKNSHGNHTDTALAAFYQGFTLPASFTEGGSGYSGTLYSTKPGVTPDLPAPTSWPVLRSSTFSW
jgi:hypothetical protein